MVKQDPTQKSPISSLLMELLVCPACKGDLQLTDHPSSTSLDCPACTLSYPIVDGIPVMLIDQAKATE